MTAKVNITTQWEKLEIPLKKLSVNLKKAIIYHENNAAFTIEYYFCHSVMELAHFLRTQTKALELGSQHHTFKILFKFVKYGDYGCLEYPIQDGRADIFLKHENRIIEVKTITQMTLHKLYQKVLGVLESESPKSDILWVFYFYKLKESSPIAPECQYLLSFISIDLLDIDQDSNKWDLSRMVEESKVHIAEKLKITPEFIIPLENLLKVEDLERELADQKQKLVEEKQRNDEKDQKLAEKDQKLAEKDQEIIKLKALLEQSHKQTKSEK